MTAPYQIYRLTIDANGQEDITDFTSLYDAQDAFQKATNRKGVFSADVRAYSTKTFLPTGGRIYSFQKPD